MSVIQNIVIGACVFVGGLGFMFGLPVLFHYLNAWTRYWVVQ